MDRLNNSQRPWASQSKTPGRTRRFGMLSALSIGATSGCAAPLAHRRTTTGGGAPSAATTGAIERYSGVDAKAGHDVLSFAANKRREAKLQAPVTVRYEARWVGG